MQKENSKCFTYLLYDILAEVSVPWQQKENHTQQDMQQDSQNVVDKSENQLVGQERKK